MYYACVHKLHILFVIDEPLMCSMFLEISWCSRLPKITTSTRLRTAKASVHVCVYLYVKCISCFYLIHIYLCFIRCECSICRFGTSERQWVEAQVENAKQQAILLALKGQVNSDEAHIHLDLHSLRYKTNPFDFQLTCMRICISLITRCFNNVYSMILTCWYMLLLRPFLPQLESTLPHILSQTQFSLGIWTLILGGGSIMKYMTQVLSVYKLWFCGLCNSTS